MWLIKDTPESRGESTGAFRFDYTGLLVFIITMLAINVFITYGADFGWTSFITIAVAVVAIVGAIVFYRIEKGKEVALIDFTIF